jgi:hypothetical protein
VLNDRTVLNDEFEKCERKRFLLTLSCCCWCMCLEGLTLGSQNLPGGSRKNVSSGVIFVFAV